MEQKKKRRKTKGQMARGIVYFCIRVLTVVLIWAMVMETVAVLLDKMVDLSAVLTFAATAFGGELLLCAFKRVFAKPQDNQDGMA